MLDLKQHGQLRLSPCREFSHSEQMKHEQLQTLPLFLPSGRTHTPQNGTNDMSPLEAQLGEVLSKSADYS